MKVRWLDHLCGSIRGGLGIESNARARYLGRIDLNVVDLHCQHWNSLWDRTSKGGQAFWMATLPEAFS